MNGDEDLPNNRAVAGSVSVLHEATGLNLTVAGGERFYNEKVELNDAALGTPQDASFIYVKPGLLVNMFSTGHTAFYAEYGKWRNFLGRNADGEVVAGLAGFDEEEVCLPGKACLVSQSEATIWGFGVVQRIEHAEMDVFLGFRLYQADVDLTDNAGAKIPSVASMTSPPSCPARSSNSRLASAAQSLRSFPANKEHWCGRRDSNPHGVSPSGF